MKELSSSQGELPLGPYLIVSNRGTDLLWEALLQACNIAAGDLTRAARGAANRACAELREVNADADEVFRRAARYRTRWPRMTLTPSALVKHWPQLTDSGPRQVSDRQVQVQGTISRAIGAVFDEHISARVPTVRVDVRGELL